MRRNILGALALLSLAVAIGDAGVSQTGFRFEPDTRARMIRMMQADPAVCVELIEEAQSLTDLREALVETVRTRYRTVKIVEAARALRELDLSEEMTLRELEETAAALEMETQER